MPMFFNPTDKPLDFEIAGAGEHYNVPPGAACEIPKAFVYVIAARGLPLVKGAPPGAEVTDSEAIRPERFVYPAGVENMGAESAAEDDEDATDNTTEAAPAPSPAPSVVAPPPGVNLGRRGRAKQS